MPRMRRILFASDFSKASAKAFATAVTMAQVNRASLTILHVIVPFVPVVPEQFIDAATWEKVNQQARKWSRLQLNKLIARAKRSGVGSTALLVEGDPSREIVRLARSKRCDLLVMGTHGRTGLKKLFVGSVAARVMATAPCPLLTVRSA